MRVLITASTLPRWDGDGMELSWPVRNPPREQLEQVAARIRAALSPKGTSFGA